MVIGGDIKKLGVGELKYKYLCLENVKVLFIISCCV